MGGEMLSSAKVRLCGSWAAKLATRASDVNFTVLLQPNSLFAMLDAKVCSTGSTNDLEETTRIPSRPFTSFIPRAIGLHLWSTFIDACLNRSGDALWYVGTLGTHILFACRAVQTKSRCPCCPGSPAEARGADES